MSVRRLIGEALVVAMASVVVPQVVFLIYGRELPEAALLGGFIGAAIYCVAWAIGLVRE